MSSGTTKEAALANQPFGELVIRSLGQLGVRHFVISPGSRSTPLTMALGGLDPDQRTVILDERSAAFHALGRIKGTGSPVALVCTSGSAGAHYYPAVIEAREAGLPLLVLTADRPPELRHCHAGQTIDQHKLFGSYPLFYTELPLPASDPVLFRLVRETCRVAVESAMGLPSGPVHINCPFREPFFSTDGAPVALDSELLNGLVPVERARSGFAHRITLPQRTLILAGPTTGMEPHGLERAVLELSGHGHFPVLVDGANSLRYTAEASGQRIIHYDRIARDDGLWKALAPDAVVLIGEPPTSKRLRERLAAMDLPGYLVGSGKRSINPFFGRVTWIGDLPGEFDFEDTANPRYLDQWQEAESTMEGGLVAMLGEPHDLFEGDLHRLLGEVLPEGAPVVYASSLAIRDAEWFMPANDRRLRPYSQRGANGIDGTLSLARGIAAGHGIPAWLVTGDLAFLHDANGLNNFPSDGAGLFVVLVNNAGGGIFEMLPVAHRSKAFEEFFATPQAVDFAGLVKAHGGRHAHCAAIEDLRHSVTEWDGQGLFVAEVPVDRKSSKRLHRETLLMKD